jgi:energy-coupling factor transporter ATP-binding protein EcfA2
MRLLQDTLLLLLRVILLDEPVAVKDSVRADHVWTLREIAALLD